MDLKPKREDSKVSLSSQEVDRHLDGLNDFIITADPLAPLVKREFLRTAYGIHGIHIVSRFNKNGPAGGHVVICCRAELNPGLPVTPGGRGFLLSNRIKAMCIPEFSLFCRVSIPVPGGREARWRYNGEYRGRHTGFLSPLGFDMQTDKVCLLMSIVLLFITVAH